MRKRTRAVFGIAVCAAVTLATAAALPASANSGSGQGDDSHVVRAAVEPGEIKNVVVIDLENENFDSTFGPSSPAHYLNDVLVPSGELLENYYATSHVSLGNYVSQVSGQASTPTQNNDCINLASLAPPGPVTGQFTNIAPGTPAVGGQVIGDGCVFPSFVMTIGSQLDAQYGSDKQVTYPWRAYAEDMGNDPARDYGTPDPLGGTDCAHAPIGGVDHSNSAAANDQYATRHNGFVYFHSTIDDTANCSDRVVPLGTVTVGQNGAPDTFSGHLAQDFAKKKTTPLFSIISPNLCNDGHDATCTGVNTEGGHAGGLVGADLWLKHWIPFMMSTPSYKSGEMLIVITFDEAGVTDATACCGEQPGPNLSNPGFSPLLGMFGLQKPPTAPGQYPGGGKVGAVLLTKKYIVPGTDNTTGSYNHYSALRSYEDILGVTSGGDDGLGHLGFAGADGLLPFGSDVFNRH
jgi:hypothetical protein